MIDDYARLLEAIAEYGDDAGAERVVRKLIAYLESTGRTKMLPQILRRLRALAARRAALAPTVEVAHEREAREALRAAAAEGIEEGKAVVNPALISGWRAKSGGRLVDRSGKEALVRIYQKVTS
ncbi:MAG TPA: F0F1 ATP synthase subunit delta [Candidatus Paceibacterota bacterium]|nr:F0F1 ATP synthase subunit delta [Candidatus Paceibacterota bacterium]